MHNPSLKNSFVLLCMCILCRYICAFLWKPNWRIHLFAFSIPCTEYESNSYDVLFMHMDHYTLNGQKYVNT